MVRREKSKEAQEAAEITLRPSEVVELHNVLHDFLELAGEGEGRYVVVPVVAESGLDADETARNLVRVLGQPGVAEELTHIGFTKDIASLLHGAVRLTEMQEAVADLKRHLADGDVAEAVYQEWCTRHSWAFGNAYVARDSIRTIGVGDEVDVLMEAAASGLRDVFELKRPNMDVVKYDRSHKSWYWSSDTVKAIAQCHRYLDVLHELSARRLRDRPEIAAYHPRAVIVIGRSETWDAAQHEALHGLNARLHSITVTTYDYLLAQAKALLAAFQAP